MTLLSYLVQFLYQFCGGVLPDCKVVKIDVVESEDVVKLIGESRIVPCPEEHARSGMCVCMSCERLEVCQLEKSFRKTCLARFITTCSIKSEIDGGNNAKKGN